MCGIAGWVSYEGRRPDRETLSRMAGAMLHRGPDAGGLFVDANVGLAHRRLSILDLSEESNQPMSDRSGRYTVVFNGEIYNFRELRRELADLGCVFTTQGDTEVLLQSIIRWGPAALGRFTGMFAFAVWDKVTKRLLLARDRLGKKPLFFARLKCGGVVFASEPGSVAMHPDVDCTVDPVSLAHYLRLNYVPCHRSLFRGIESLPPASYMELSPGKPPRALRYWDLAEKFRSKRRFRSDGEAADELRSLIDEAVKARLVADVPLGAFLSGGVDSSTIVASMLQHRDAGSIFTFSSGFVEDSYDESVHAEELARLLGIFHRTERLDTAQLDISPAVLTTAAEPLADTSALPMYFLSRFTRQFVTVALSGDGGDECFAGYETYVADKLHRAASHSPRWLREHAHTLLDRILPVTHRKVGLAEKLRRFSAALPADFPRAHASWRDIFDARELPALLRQDWREEAARSENRDLFDAYFQEHFAEVRDCDPLDQATYVDIKTWMVDDILVKADRMSMAHSLEVRCPLLDHRLVEFAASLPVELKLRGFSKKYVLRQSQRNRIPDAVLDRPKRGFNAPISQWINGPLRHLCEATLFSNEMQAWFDGASIRRLMTEHAQMKRDNGLRLFGLLTVGLFFEATRALRATRQSDDTRYPATVNG